MAKFVTRRLTIVSSVKIEGQQPQEKKIELRIEPGMSAPEVAALLLGFVQGFEEIINQDWAPLRQQIEDRFSEAAIDLFSGAGWGNNLGEVLYTADPEDPEAAVFASGDTQIVDNDSYDSQQLEAEREFDEWASGKRLWHGNQMPPTQEEYFAALDEFDATCGELLTGISVREDDGDIGDAGEDYVEGFPLLLLLGQTGFTGTVLSGDFDEAFVNGTQRDDLLVVTGLEERKPRLKAAHEQAEPGSLAMN